MFDYVVNTRLSLVVNKVWYDAEPKNPQKIKLLLNGTDKVKVEQWAKM